MPVSVHPLSQEERQQQPPPPPPPSLSSPPLDLDNTTGTSSPANMTPVGSPTTAVLSNHHHHLSPTAIPDPYSYDSPFYAPQSPELPYPGTHQQRAYSVTAMTSEYQRSVLRHQQQLAERQQQQQLLAAAEQPWWQYYYQLYHYHPPPGRKPTIFGPYLLLQTLGEGEFGKVKLGIHIESGYEVAIKLIKKDNIDSSSRMSKVEREISVLRKVRHPYIVKLYDVIETDRYIGIILQCASGGELFEYILAHRYLKEKDASRLFAQLISGVHYMHQKHIVHRDLKLENLLLDKNRCIIITDFGFANQFASAKDDLMSTSCGSPCYAAPELVVSDGLYVGSAVDIWSCGVILYAMLCGYLPFDDDPENPDGDNINLLYKYILNTPLAFPDYVSEDARDLLRKMLVPDPKKRCSMKTIMEHPWLSEHRDLFKKSVEELEKEVVDPIALPLAAMPPQPELPLSPVGNPNIPGTTDRTEPPIAVQSPPSEPDDAKPTAEDDQTVPNQEEEASGEAMEIDQKEEQQTVQSDETPRASDAKEVEALTEEEKDKVPDIHVSEREESMTRDISSLELPAAAHADNESTSGKDATMSDQRSATSESRMSEDAPRPSPQPSKTVSKRVHQRGAEKLLSFLSGTRTADSIAERQTSPGRTTRKTTRPFSTSVEQQRPPSGHHSILHAKFLSSMQRHQQQQQQQDIKAVPGARNEGPTISMSTPQGVGITRQQLALKPLPRAPQEPSRSSMPATTTSPQPTVGTSHPVRGTRRKALSLFVNPMATENDTKLTGSVSSKRPAPRYQQPHSSRSRLLANKENRQSSIPPSVSERNTRLPPSPTSPEVLPKDYKHRSAGKKLMDWFKKKPLSTRDRHYELLAHQQYSQTSVMRAMPIGKPLGAYAVDFNDAKLRTHHGAVDHEALTSRSPNEVFLEIKQTLLAMGIDVKDDGEYKLKCVRRKRVVVPVSSSSSSTTSPKKQQPNNNAGQNNMHVDPKKRKTSANNTQKIRMLLRRGSSMNNNVAMDEEGEEKKNPILYGDPVVDPGEEVRFSMELCKIKNLPGLYIVDIRRMRGNVWSYKYLYHAVLGALDLGGKGGYMSTRVPGKDKQQQLQPTLEEPEDTSPGDEEARNHQRISTISSSNDSSCMDDVSARGEEEQQQQAVVS